VLGRTSITHIKTFPLNLNDLKIFNFKKKSFYLDPDCGLDPYRTVYGSRLSKKSWISFQVEVKPDPQPCLVQCVPVPTELNTLEKGKHTAKMLSTIQIYLLYKTCTGTGMLLDINKKGGGGGGNLLLKLFFKSSLAFIPS
jgi:hypothetical protein